MAGELAQQGIKLGDDGTHSDHFRHATTALAEPAGFGQGANDVVRTDGDRRLKRFFPGISRSQQGLDLAHDD